MQSKLQIALREGGILTLNAHETSYWVDENVLKLIYFGQLDEFGLKKSLHYILEKGKL